MVLLGSSGFRCCDGQAEHLRWLYLLSSIPSQPQNSSFLLHLLSLCVFSVFCIYLLFFFSQLWKCYQGCVDASGLISSICGGVSMNLYKKNTIL